MKIAVCLSGQPRTVDMCVDNIMQFFSNENVDYFIHAWSANTWFDGNPNHFAKYTEAVSERELAALNKFNATSIVVEPTNPELLKNNAIHSQFYSMAKSVNLALEHAESNQFVYDIVIRLRMDVIWAPGATFKVPNIAPNTLYVNTIFKNHFGHTSVFDRFFYGSSNTMKCIVSGLPGVTRHYGDTLMHESPLCPKYLWPEAAIAEYAMSHGIKLELKGGDQIDVIVRKQCLGLDVGNDFLKIIAIQNSYWN